MAKLTVAGDEQELASAAAERITSLVDATVAERGGAMISLTGGTTPRALYAALADPAQPWRARIPWPLLHVFWGDERHVPPSDPASNFGMANEALLAHVPIPASQVHRIRGELPDAGEAARLYQEAIRDAFETAGRRDRTFDVMLLGLGEDAHVASIFPYSPLLDAWTAPHLHERVAHGNDATVAAVWAPHLEAWRITLTPPALLDSRAIVMLVAGPKKADAVWAALEAAEDERRYPAQLLRRAADRVQWLMDRPAAARLPGAPRA